MPAIRDDAEVPNSLAVDALLRALAEELPPTRAARVAASATGLPRDALYEQIRALKAGTE